MEENLPKKHYLKDYQFPDFYIDTVHLHFEIYEEYTSVKSLLKIRRNPIALNQQAVLQLDGEDLSLKSVSVDGRHLSAEEYSVSEEYLTIAKVPNQFSLETEVIIKPHENTQLSGLYQSRTNLCTQCEAHGFRRITYYLDRPDVMARFTTTISADQRLYPILLSNGNLIEKKMLDEHRQWVHWEDPSLKSCYLFALVAGDFDLLVDEYVTQSNRTIILQMYLEKGYGDRGEHALASLKRAMRWDEKTFGREYDLDLYMIVAVSDFNMGAMENKGLNIFNTKYILTQPELSTDADYIGVESVIGHEYFHNWSGNRITCRDWFQITLKEGLTVFREQLFSEDMIGASVVRIDNVNVIKNRQFPEDAGPNAHPIRPQSYIEVNNFYTSTVYYKGSEVIRMIYTLLGREQFLKAMDLYFTRHDGQAVTTDDFVRAMEDSSQKDLTQFRRWYDQAGTPQLNISGQYHKDNTFTLTVEQSCPATPGQLHKEPFHLPLAMSLLDHEGQEIPLQLINEKTAVHGTRILEIKNTKEVFTFIHVKHPPIPSLLRNFSAPVRLTYPYTAKELAHLLCYDRDPVSRWEAGQMLATNLILELIKDQQEGRALIFPVILSDYFSQILAKKMGDNHLLTRVLTLPSLQYLMQQMKKIDIDTLYKVIEFLKQQLATMLEEIFLATYNQLHQPNLIFQYEHEQVGNRSLKNLSLKYLVTIDKSDYVDLADQQFKQSNNMTDTMGALWALNDSPNVKREQALTAFYNRWKNEPLIINKWLMLHAMSVLPDTTLQVRELLKNPAFSLVNPNNVYSLLGSFAHNIIHFHAVDGSGYQLLAEQVLLIDKKNPQVAARIVEPLTRWQNLDQNRINLMRDQLFHIEQSIGLSRDVYELVSKSLSITQEDRYE